MNHPLIKVLLIEDNEKDYILIRNILANISGGNYQLDWVSNIEEGAEAIKKDGYQVYLIAYHPHKNDGLEFLNNALDSYQLQTPFITLARNDDPEMDMKAMRSGAADFLIKSNLTPELLDRTIRYAIQQTTTIRALQKKRSRLKTAQRIAKIGSWEWVIQTDEVHWSDQLFRNLGYVPGAIEPTFEAFFQRVISEDREKIKQHIKDTLEHHLPYQFEYRIQIPDGSIRYIYEDGELEMDENGKPWKIIGTAQDLTDRKRRERELQFKNTAIETAVIPIAFADMEGKITNVNQAFLQTWGYDQIEEIIGMPVTHFSNCPEKAKEIMSALEQTGIYQGEDVARHKDGSSFDIYISANIVIDLQGVPIGMQSTFLDITELKETKRALEQKNRLVQHLNYELEDMVKERTQELSESQQRLREAQHMAGVGHWQADLESGNFHWSETLYDLIGLDRNTPITRELELNFVHPDDRKMMKNYLSNARKTGEGEPIDFRIITNSGKELWMQTQVKKYKLGESGQVKKIFGIVKDITDTTLAARALEEALAKERHLSQTKSRFVSMASHEFRTPLTTIMASVDLIEIYLERGEYHKQQKHIKRIAAAVTNLTSILNDFLSLEKLESDSVELNPETFKWSGFATELVNDVSSMCLSGQEVTFKHEGPKMVKLDRHLLKNILLNLLSNAIKYSPRGQSVEVVSHYEENQLIIEVKDQGIGIPPEEQKRMFVRFFRASNVENIKGTGLGLTIVKRYLDLMKGSISFTSDYGKGSTFRVEIPHEVFVEEVKRV